jgi:hypothetical protein
LPERYHTAPELDLETLQSKSSQDILNRMQFQNACQSAMKVGLETFTNGRVQSELRDWIFQKAIVSVEIEDAERLRDRPDKTSAPTSLTFFFHGDCPSSPPGHNRRETNLFTVYSMSLRPSSVQKHVTSLGWILLAGT